jgi:biuret amidohydrolase
MQLDPRTTAVVAVHCQGDIVGPDGAFAGHFYQQVVERNVLDRIAALTDAMRDAGATIAYTRVAWQPDYSDLQANSPILRFVAQSGCLKDGTRLAEIVEPLTPRRGDLVITHQRVGGFTGSAFDDALRDRGIQTLVFAGVATNFSVEGTAREASDLGYHVLIVDDACAAASLQAHAASLGSLGLLAEIVTVDDVLAALPSTAAAAKAR